MWARIESEMTVEITDVDPAGRFHPSITWIACSADVKCGMRYTGHSFLDAKPDLKKLAMEARAERDYRMRNFHDIYALKLSRELRLADADQVEAVNVKIAALDDYAVALLNIPQQVEFPTNITWPEDPAL